MAKEIWKNIKGFSGRYQVSSFGRIRSFCKYDNGEILRNNADSNGYESIQLSSAQRVYRHRIHRLVANAFLKKEKNKNEVNHKDGNKKNNCVENLEWVNRSENNKHAYNNGFKVPFILKGEQHGRAKLSDIDVLKIRSLYKPREISLNMLAVRFSVSKRSVGRIIHGFSWAHI